MKIEKITLRPFAGVADRTVQFPDGLSVLLGANEAGKSTLFAAIHEGLFRHTKPRRGSDDYKAIQNYLPLGGNQSKVHLTFTVDGAVAVVERTWGEGAGASFSIGGATTAGHDEAGDMILSRLPVSQAVFESVLLAGQGSLRETLESLSKTGANKELQDMLRETVQVAGGVSVSDFEARLTKRFEETFGQWDLALNAPVGNRGLSAPWRKNVGRVLKAWYAMKQTEVDWQAAIAFETKRDELERRLADLVATGAKDAAVLMQYGNIEQGIKSRQNAALRLENAVRSTAEYRDVNKEWPVLEASLQSKNEGIPEKEARRVALTEELARAQALALLEPTRDQVARAEPLQVEVSNLKERLNGLKKVTRVDVDQVRRADERLRLARASREASGMKVDFKAVASTEITYSVDGATETVRSLTPGETLSFTAASRWQIGHPTFGLSVKSGSEDGAHVLEEERAARIALAELLGKLAMADVPGALAAAAAWEEAEKALQLKERDLAGVLKGQDLAALKGKLAAAPAPGAARPVIDVLNEKNTVEHSLSDLRKDIAACQERLALFQRKYESHDALFVKVAEASAAKLAAETEIANLPQVPPEFRSAEDFLAALDGARDRETRVKEQISALKIERAGHVGNEERTSADERKVEYEEAKGEFDHTLAQGKRLVRIREALDAVKSRQQVAPLSGLKESFERYFSKATGNKYTTAHAEEGMPGGLVRAEGGEALDYSLLSSGTKDLFALCLRFAMADCFLKDKEGFLLLDDPMVNLDPGRQRLAADLLQEVAKKHQVVVFTCHPSHGDLMGGTKIPL